MNKNYYTKKFKFLFKLPKNSRIAFFRHPKEFSFIRLEKINPDHIIIMWGMLRKKYRHCKQAYMIKMGKITIPLIVFMHTYAIDRFVIPSDIPILSMYAFVSMIIVYASIIYPIKREITYVDRNTGRSRYWQNCFTHKVSID